MGEKFPLGQQSVQNTKCQTYLFSLALADGQLDDGVGQDAVIVAVAEGADLLHQQTLGAVHGHHVVVHL